MSKDKQEKLRQLKEIHAIIKGRMYGDAKALYGSWEQMLDKGYELEKEVLYK